MHRNLKKQCSQQNLSLKTDRTKITILYGFWAVQEKSCTAVHQFSHLCLQVYTLIPIIISFIGSLFIQREGYNAEVRDHSLKEEIAAIAIDDLLNRYKLLIPIV